MTLNVEFKTVVVFWVAGLEEDAAMSLMNWHIEGWLRSARTENPKTNA